MGSFFMKTVGGKTPVLLPDGVLFMCQSELLQSVPICGLLSYASHPICNV